MYNLKSAIKFNNMNLIRNSIQYSIGSILYFLTFGTSSIFLFFAGLIGFLIAYNSVYKYNDLMDCKEDKKSKVKKSFKPLACGKVNREHVESYSFLLMLVGLSICFLVNLYFGVIISFLLFLNFLHSSPFTRVKKTKLLLPNLFFIEFIKYSLGWLIMSFSLFNFPFLLIALLSLIYLIGYLYYKQDVKSFFNFKIEVLCAFSIIFYILSVFFYPFKLALLIPLPLLSCFIAFKRLNNTFVKYRIVESMVYIIGVCFVISMLLLNVPVVAELNNDLNNRIDAIKENITEILPADIRYNIENIGEKVNNIDIDNFDFRNVKIS